MSKDPRDPTRIPKLLARLQEIWKRAPDLRLGQLILNLENQTDKPLYYVEDETLIETLESLYRSN